MQFYYIGVIKFMQKNDFPVGSLSICGVLECVKDFFECHGVSRLFVGNFPDMSVGSAAYFFDKRVSLENVGFNFLAHG